MNTIIQIAYFAAIILFILGLKGMSSPVTARKGIVWAGLGMLIATLVTFGVPEMKHFGLMLLAIAIGGVFAWYAGVKVKMTDMPQMIALFNGLGGGSAAAISAVELIRATTEIGSPLSKTVMIISIVGAMIGCLAFTGSLIAFAKLQGWMNKSIRFPKQHQLNLMMTIAMFVIGLGVMAFNSSFLLLVLFGLSLFLGLSLTVPIGGADMPVVISLYNAFTGLAVAAEGFVLDNPAMIIAGTIVGSSGTLLTQLMAKAMNRSLGNILFGNFGDTVVEGGEVPKGSMKAMEFNDAAVSLQYARNVIIIPGYGMAVAQAQHKVWELTQVLISRGVNVKFGIHPVAGRMPGHMNVLLAEAGVPYDLIYDMEDINSDFNNCDVAIVIGANDVVNPDARTNKSSPIYGMPILNADYSKQVFAVKRGKGVGFSGIENPLFFFENTFMLFGDAQSVMNKLIQGLKQFES